MTTTVYRRDTCRLCGSRSLELVLPLTPSPLVDAFVPAERLHKVQESFPLDLYLCHGCGHSQLLDVVDPQLVYGDDIYVTESSLGLTEHFQRYAGEVLRRQHPKEDSLVVDIGSNDGTLLRSFQRRGMRVLGVDPATAIANKATASGIETLPAFFSLDLAKQIKAERGPAAIITANNLFANIDNLDEFADGVRNLLDNAGVFVFESFYLPDMIQNFVFDLIYHEHLNCFSVKPLVRFFSRHRLELIDVDRVSTKGGSIRVAVQPAGGPQKVSPSVAELASFEDNLGVGSREIFRDLAAKIEQFKKQLNGLLRELKARGKSIAGYGASATTTALIYQCDIGDLLDFIVDDNPAKQNLFSPGHHLPVLGSQAIYERKPDYIVVLAWRFSEPIMLKHQAYLDQGGRFIVPLPKLQVL